MLLSLLQLNIYQGKFLDNIVRFLKERGPDILQFQEVTNGSVNYGNVDCFSEIKKLGYEGDLVKSWNITGDPSSYFGNATFYKPGLSTKDKKTIWLRPFQEIPNMKEFPAQYLPRAALALLFTINGKDVWLINTHQGWSPRSADTPEKLWQGQVLFDFLNGLNAPFILTGDFNLTPDSQVIQQFSATFRNLTTEYGITNTLNLSVHKAKDELSPRGLVVDYVFAHPAISVQSLETVSDIDLSDHLGLALTFSV